MAQSHVSGPRVQGPIREGTGQNTGGVVLTQTATFAFGDTGTTATSIILPAGSQIIDQIVDVTTVWNSVTSDALEIGDGTDPDIYGDVADLQVLGRVVVDPDGTQGAAIDDIGTADVTINIAITSAGGSLSTGAARLTITYRQN